MDEHGLEFTIRMAYSIPKERSMWIQASPDCVSGICIPMIIG